MIRFPFDPANRIYFLYLATSALFAYAVFRRQARAGRTGKRASFLRFLFPAHVWSHPSAWLDLRYFFFHQLIGHFLLLGLGAASTSYAFEWFSGGVGIIDAATSSEAGGAAGLGMAVGFMFVATLVVDFVAYVIHYLQHKVPVLWQFHKVHHSAEVMHPLSNYREHPIDNLVYAAVIGGSYGLVAVAAYKLLGYIPTMPMLLGVPLLMLAFNLAGYNLRHSHVWLRWPGVWSKIFPSPAHHHVHHSCHPDHFDKNFAFMFPVWDVLFGTYVVPEDNRDVVFGIHDKKSAAEMNSCVKLYFVPFRDAWRLLKRRYGRRMVGALARVRVRNR
ncbi:sterol desaturase family protein [Defluviimonas salinarum]|uniref:sterol desaturase family protein n=1 Tax=Defluviimonas salinarum TaxID=2992147 RepID=UPI0022323B1E